MGTTTVTLPARTKAKVSKVELAPEPQRFMSACQDIANQLIHEYEASHDDSKPKKDINLNSLRGQVSRKFKLSSQPPLSAIISAVPEQYKKYILPKLLAKPVRSASGIAVHDSPLRH